MPDFVKLQNILGACVTCSSHADKRGFLDLLVEREIGIGGLRATTGRLYMCASCVREASKHFGGMLEERADELAERLVKAAQVEQELRKEIEELKLNKVMTVNAAKAAVLDAIKTKVDL